MPESNETCEQPKRSFVEKIAGPAVWTGCFVIWPATSLACAYFGFKTVDKQFALETLKAAANEVK